MRRLYIDNTIYLGKNVERQISDRVFSFNLISIALFDTTNPLQHSSHSLSCVALNLDINEYFMKAQQANVDFALFPHTTLYKYTHSSFSQSLKHSHCTFFGHVEEAKTFSFSFFV